MVSICRIGLAKLDHPNVVRYYTSWLEPSWMQGSRNRDYNVMNSNSMKSKTDKMNPGMNRSDGIPKNKEIERKLLMDVHQLILTREEEEETRNDIFHRISMHVGERDIKYRKSRTSNYSWNESDDYDDDDNDDDDSDYSKWTTSSSSEQESRIMNHRQKQSIKQDTDVAFPRRTMSYKYQICLFIQMQLCHSSTLADWIFRRNQTMTSPQSSNASEQIDYHQHARPAFEIFRQVLKGLVHVHARGIIHRDLKPANIFASEGGVFKIGDFGLSKLLNIFDEPRDSFDDKKDHVRDDTRRVLLLPSDSMESDSSTAERTDRHVLVNVWSDLHTAGVGTASYAAPEQMRSTSYGPEADIFR